MQQNARTDAVKLFGSLPWDAHAQKKHTELLLVLYNLINLINCFKVAL